ncbi:hypothetical protein ABW19_dt0206035 [Dactylella cylindrospora]|nr:hypothetical protein ABW19_dt0206035 [Dactylella cylindrospora]
MSNLPSPEDPGAGDRIDLSTLFVPSANDQGEPPTLDECHWEMICSASIPHPAEQYLHGYEETVLNVVIHPEYLSPILTRADVVSDSNSDINGHGLLLEGKRSSNVPTAAHAKDDLGFIGTFSTFEVTRRVILRNIPRNPLRDKRLDQSIWVFKKVDFLEVQDKTSRRKTDCDILVTLVPHVTNMDDCPYYFPDARAIAIEISRDLISIHALLRGCVPQNSRQDSNAGVFSSSPDANQSLTSGINIDRRSRMLNKLLEVMRKHFSNPEYTKRVNHDTIISRERYQSTYQNLKAKHADRLCRIFESNGYRGKGCRELDKLFEELGIASFCICLWEEIYYMPGSSYTEGCTSESPPKRPFGGFVDLGCGSGVLADILIEEGWLGYGIDARRRRVWDSYDEKVQSRLFESILIPYLVEEGYSSQQVSVRTDTRSSLQARIPTVQSSYPMHGTPLEPFYRLPGESQLRHCGMFPEGTFLICNHGDQLTAWTPLLATPNRCPFLVIPCCSFNLAGKRFRAHQGSHLLQGAQKQAKMSTYQSLITYIEGLCLDMGVVPEKEWLRIPSTRNRAILGREYQIDHPDANGRQDDSVRSREKLVESLISREGGAEGWTAVASELSSKDCVTGAGH